MGCIKDLYEGRNYLMRSGEAGLEYVTNLAQKFADLQQENMVVYERNLYGKGSFYAFTNEKSSECKPVRIIRFNKKPADTDVLRDTGNEKPATVKSKKQKGKK